jgi:hypothetical protein
VTESATTGERRIAGAGDRPKGVATTSAEAKSWEKGMRRESGKMRDKDGAVSPYGLEKKAICESTAPAVPEVCAVSESFIEGANSGERTESRERGKAAESDGEAGLMNEGESVTNGAGIEHVARRKQNGKMPGM